MQARIQDFFFYGEHENQGHSSIELGLYKQYIAEWRAKRS